MGVFGGLMGGGRKRRFGRVRQLRSGRWQARYLGADGIDRPAPSTFPTKRAAEVWLSVVEAEIVQGVWLDPDAGLVPLGECAKRWINERPGLAPKTVVLYEGLLRRHIRPELGGLAVADVTAARVRSWRQSLLDGGVGPVTVAKAYRLLKSVLKRPWMTSSSAGTRAGSRARGPSGARSGQQ